MTRGWPSTPGEKFALRFFIFYRPIAWPIAIFQTLLAAAFWIIVFTRPAPISVPQGVTVVAFTVFAVAKCYLAHAIGRVVDTYRKGLRRDGTR